MHHFQDKVSIFFTKIPLSKNKIETKKCHLEYNLVYSDTSIDISRSFNLKFLPT